MSSPANFNGLRPVIDVSNDGEISYILHKYEFFNSLC